MPLPAKVRPHIRVTILVYAQTLTSRKSFNPPEEHEILHHMLQMCRLSRSASRAIVVVAEPSLEHQNCPQRRSGIAAPTQMLAPPALNRLRIEPAVRAHGARIEKVLRPWPKRAREPLAHRNGKACFGPLDEDVRHHRAE